MRAFPTAASLRQAESDELRTILRPLGLRWRIDLLIELLGEVGRRGGRLPRDEGGLRELPGVGPYAASAALSLHGARRAVIVDSNVVRVLSRLADRPFDSETRRARWLRDLADRLTPQTDYARYNYALLDLAMTVCTPRHPGCVQCPLRSLCPTGSES